MKKEQENTVKELISFFAKKDAEKKSALKAAKKQFIADLVKEVGNKEAKQSVKLIASF